jgi:hypothetical protein
MCSLCKTSFNSVFCLNVHLSSRHQVPLERTALECPSCNIQLNNEATLHQHVFTNHPYWIRLHKRETNNYMQSCPACSLRLNARNLNEHLKTVHAALDYWQCYHCLALYYDSEQLQGHLLDVYSNLDTGNRPLHFCGICGLQQNNDVALEKHMLIEHCCATGNQFRKYRKLHCAIASAEQKIDESIRRRKVRREASCQPVIQPESGEFFVGFKIANFLHKQELY